MRYAPKLPLWFLVLLVLPQTGCTPIAPVRPAPSTALTLSPSDPPTIQQASYQPSGDTDTRSTGSLPPTSQEVTLPPPTPATPRGAPTPASGSPFDNVGELTPELLVRQVLARNPSLEQMVAAWKAVEARYPQVTSLDDPMFGAVLAPGGLGTTGDASNGYRIDVAQRLPWCGKRTLRGQNVQAQARAAADDVDSMRLQLIESARSAFFDYYLVAREIEVNADNLRLLRDFRQNAETRYKNGVAPQQDVLQADVEIGRQKKRSVTLERMRQVAIARINTLLNLDPGVPLPPPPKKVEVADGLPEAAALRSAALERRPDLRALGNRIQAEEAALSLAFKEYYPDFDVMAAYDGFWTEPGLRPQIALRMNLPVRLERREAAVWEARARLAERRAELQRQVNQVNYEVSQAHAEVNESKQTVRLYEQTVLPAAELNVKSAQSAYLTGSIPFLTLLEAEREVIGLREEYYEFVADYHRRLATLERAIGGPLTALGRDLCQSHP
jgi:cobalt-zinc-cadmium efflux system outer membrane protein